MRLARALKACLAWVEDHGGSLTFEAGGTVSLNDEEGDTCGQVDGFTLESGADVLAELLEDANRPTPAPASTLPAIDYKLTWFGFGETRFAWGERQTIILTPERELAPQRLVMPSGCAHYLVHQMHFAGQPLLVNEDGIPGALFSELTTAPQILFPRIGPGRPLTLDVSAPPCPKAPHPFSGAVYGHATEPSQ